VANKGLQFEHAVMYAATSQIINRDSYHEKMFEESVKKISTIPKDIMETAKEIVMSMAPKNIDEQQIYFKSFKKMSGGGEEPKTDILFEVGGKKYKCSMKWGKSFQLTSAGVDKSVQVFKKVLEKVAKDYSSKKDSNTLGYLQSLLENIARTFENQTGTMTQDVAKRIMSDVKKSGGINEQLQTVLGSRKNPSVSEVYDKFKFELTKECMTGEMLFGKNSDKTATHIFTEHGIKEITDEVIRDVMKVAGVRISLKGRGKDASGVRQNAISIRYEV
jgi:hypothetical protein